MIDFVYIQDFRFGMASLLSTKGNFVLRSSIKGKYFQGNSIYAQDRPSMAKVKSAVENPTPNLNLKFCRGFCRHHGNFHLTLILRAVKYQSRYSRDVTAYADRSPALENYMTSSETPTKRVSSSQLSLIALGIYIYMCYSTNGRY